MNARSWIRLGCFALVGCVARVQAVDADTETPPRALVTVGIIRGYDGAAEFKAPFDRAVDAWRSAAGRLQAEVVMFGETSEGPMPAREELREWLEQARSPEAALWLVYVGHGTYDGREARLNLPGPDLSAAELGEWLQPLQREVIFVHGGSASAPFLPALSRGNRVVITATRSGNETSYARFGEHFAQLIASPHADIDQDGQTSILEAFVTAAQRVRSFYEEQGRLASEHALLDDNGDREGTPAEWFRGTRLIRRPESGRVADGDRARAIAFVPPAEERALSAAAREQRAQLERELSALRARRPDPPDDAYFAQLERILRQLAELYRTDS